MYTNYNGQESPMLHTKFSGNRPAGSGEEDFLRFLLYEACSETIETHAF